MAEDSITKVGHLKNKVFSEFSLDELIRPLYFRWARGHVVAIRTNHVDFARRQHLKRLVSSAQPAKEAGVDLHQKSVFNQAFNHALALVGQISFDVRHHNPKASCTCQGQKLLDGVFRPAVHRHFQKQ